MVIMDLNIVRIAFTIQAFLPFSDDRSMELLHLRNNYQKRYYPRVNQVQTTYVMDHNHT